MEQLAKGLAIIEALNTGTGQNGFTIAEVAKVCGFSRATARRCLLALVERGYATRDDRYFALTPRILRLGNSYFASPLMRAIGSAIDALASRLKECSGAGVLERADVVCIARGPRHSGIDLGIYPGDRRPAHRTSLGRVLLASLPREEIRDIVDASEPLFAELKRVDEQGFAIVSEGSVHNVRSVAVPLRNRAGKAVAAVNVDLHMVRNPPERIQNEVLPLLFELQSRLEGDRLLERRVSLSEDRRKYCRSTSQNPVSAT